MKTLEYFRSSADPTRADPLEGSSFIKQLESTPVTDLNNLIVGHLSLSSYPLRLANPIQVSTQGPHLGSNIYCMHAISTYCTLPSYVCNGAAVLITNLDAFFSAVEEAFNKENIQLGHSGVDYYDEHKYTGTLNEFSKPKSLKHQNEYRFVAYTNSYKPYELSIGSLEHIAILLNSYQLSQFITYKNTDGTRGYSYPKIN